MAFVPPAPFSWKIYRYAVRTHVEFFSPPSEFPSVDILKLNTLPAPFPGVANISCPTMQIDLLQSEDALWENVDPKARKVIKQASREGVEVRHEELSEETWNSFLAAYNKLRSRKRNAEPLGLGQIHELVEKGQFVMTTSHDREGAVLSWHTYVRSGGHARLLNTMSDIDPARDSHWNNMVGRAHRLHHWQDMLSFKAQGVAIYDLGGVYRGTEDMEQINIARFKTSFGGVPAETFDASVPLTVKGRTALALRAGLRSIRP